MSAPIECAGVPRELGVAQGRACAGAIRAELGPGRRLALLRRRSREHRLLDRDLWRHHPQLAERTGGLALGARVARRALVEALAREAWDEPRDLCFAVEGDGVGGALLVRLFAPAPGGHGTLVVRRSRPEAGLAALEVTRPWLAPALGGVNEAGLAMVASCFAGSRGERCRAPGFVLVQDCLQRFASARVAVEWCLARPAGGSGTILAVDAAGEVAGAAIAGDRRAPLVAEAGALVGSGPEPLRGTLAKACRELARRERPSLGAALPGVLPAARALWLDPGARRLALGPVDGDELPAFQAL